MTDLGRKFSAVNQTKFLREFKNSFQKGLRVSFIYRDIMEIFCACPSFVLNTKDKRDEQFFPLNLFENYKATNSVVDILETSRKRGARNMKSTY